ncbi:hypothetical protein LXL04_004362 [Taraxacum kok-saghyz]
MDTTFYGSRIISIIITLFCSNQFSFVFMMRCRARVRVTNFIHLYSWRNSLSHQEFLILVQFVVLNYVLIPLAWKPLKSKGPHQSSHGVDRLIWRVRKNLQEQIPVYLNRMKDQKGFFLTSK